MDSPDQIILDTNLLAEYTSKINALYERHEYNSGLLYHYTSADGLFGILKNHTLRATHYSYLNDKLEGTHGQFKTNQQIDAGVRNPHTEPLCEKLIEEDFTDTTDVFVTSFSPLSDDLSLWRAYAPNGYAIGFDPDELRQNNFTQLRNLLYDDVEQEQFIDAHIKIAAEYYDRLDFISVRFHMDLATAKPYLKAKYNSVESEVRSAVHVSSDRLTALLLEKNLWPEAGFFVRSGVLVPYLPRPFLKPRARRVEERGGESRCPVRRRTFVSELGEYHQGFNAPL